jgi:hypothetical protein
MKTAFIYLIYAVTLLNLYAWMTYGPTIFYAISKWSIFMALLYAPLIYHALKEKQPVNKP